MKACGGFFLGVGLTLLIGGGTLIYLRTQGHDPVGRAARHLRGSLHEDDDDDGYHNQDCLTDGDTAHDSTG